jgi:hypothetical protein
MTLQKDLREFIESLNALDVRFLIVGAFAVAYHGYFRYTSDFDLFVDRSNENAKRVWQAVQQFGFADLKLTVETFRKRIRLSSLVFLQIELMS